METTGQCPLKLNVYMLYDSVIPLPVRCPREMCTYVHQKACTRTITVALCEIAQTGNKFPNIQQLYYVVNLKDKILYSKENKGSITTQNKSELPQFNVKWKKSDKNENILYDSVHVTLINMQN